MDKKELRENNVKVEMIELTEEEKQCLDMLDEKLAGGTGALLFCACVN